MSEKDLSLLIIEDQDFNTHLFKRGFSEYNISTAKNGIEGLQKYQETLPDIVFLDIGLPDMSGFEVLQRLKSCNPDVYVVMLSGMNTQEYFKKSRQLGAAGFLAKPYNRDFILHYIYSYRNFDKN